MPESFPDFNNTFVLYQLEKFFTTSKKKTLIKDVIRKWNMDWLAERIKIRFS